MLKSAKGGHRLQRVRVLHVLAGLDRGGAESMVMNVYRSIDRQRLQFDFVLPSLYEGLGVAVVEAQAAGLRCVVAEVVPEEARLTDLVEVVPLAAPDHVWAAEILKWSGGYDRSSNL
jgi:hypothetical protein